MRITTKGQVTIPNDIRIVLGLRPHSNVYFIREGNRVYLSKEFTLPKKSSGRFEHLRGVATVRLSTDEILKLTRGD